MGDIRNPKIQVLFCRSRSSFILQNSTLMSDRFSRLMRVDYEIDAYSTLIALTPMLLTRNLLNQEKNIRNISFATSCIRGFSAIE